MNKGKKCEFMGRGTRAGDDEGISNCQKETKAKEWGGKDVEVI